MTLRQHLLAQAKRLADLCANCGQNPPLPYAVGLLGVLQVEPSYSSTFIREVIPADYFYGIEPEDFDTAAEIRETYIYLEAWAANLGPNCALCEDMRNYDKPYY